MKKKAKKIKLIYALMFGRFDTVTQAREQRNKFLNDNYDAQSEETKLFIGNLLGV